LYKLNSFIYQTQENQLFDPPIFKDVYKYIRLKVNTTVKGYWPKPI